MAAMRRTVPVHTPFTRAHRTGHLPSLGSRRNPREAQEIRVKSMTIRRAILPGIAALSLALTACGGDSSDSGSGSASGGSSDVSSLSGTLNGGGSSAQQSAQAAWTSGFQGQASGVTINYDPVGSGTGRTNFISKAYDFAGSDSALSDD